MENRKANEEYTNDELFNFVKSGEIPRGVFQVLKKRASLNRLKFVWVLKVWEDIYLHYLFIMK